MARSLLPRLKKLFSLEIFVSKKLDSSISGKKTYGTRKKYSARIKGQHRLVEETGGKISMSDVEIWVYGTPALDKEDKFELPLPFTPQFPKVVSIENVTDENGIHHVKLLFS